MFTRCGHLRFSSKKTDWEQIYHAMIAILGGTGPSAVYDFTIGTYMEASVYARSQVIARTRGLLERAKNQRDPAKALEFIPVLEKDRRITPAALDTIQIRRDRLVARSRQNRGAVRESVEDQLRQLLGADFLYYRVTRESEQTLWPTTPPGVGVYTSTSFPPRAIKLLDATPFVGIPDAQTPYGDLDGLGNNAVRINVGDRLCVDAGDLENAEAVTVTSSSIDSYGVQYFGAQYALYHPAGAVATTGPFPAQTSTRRFAFVVVSASAAISPTKVANIGEVMRRVARGISAWAVVQLSTATTIGPFVINTSPLGATPFASMAVP